MLTYHLEQLNTSLERLTEDIETSAPLEAATPTGGMFREASRSFPEFSIAAPEHLRDAGPSLRTSHLIPAMSQKSQKRTTGGASLLVSLLVGKRLACAIPSRSIPYRR